MMELQDITFLQWVCVALSLALGGIIKGAIGFGLPLFSISLLSSIIPVELALALMPIPLIVSNLWLSLQGGQAYQSIKRFWLVIFCVGIGVFLGSQVVVGISQAALLFMLGVVIICMSVLELFKRPSIHILPQWTEKIFGSLIGLISGFFGGLTTICGPPLVIYLNSLDLSKDTFIASLNVIIFFTSIFIILAFGKVGILTIETGAASALGSLPVLAGLYAGTYLRTFLSQRIFQRVVLLALFLLGLNLIRRAL